MLVLVGVAFGMVAAEAPPFSWDTVPVFCETSNVTGVFDEEAIKTIARYENPIPLSTYNHCAETDLDWQAGIYIDTHTQARAHSCSVNVISGFWRI